MRIFVDNDDIESLSKANFSSKTNKHVGEVLQETKSKLAKGQKHTHKILINAHSRGAGTPKSQGELSPEEKVRKIHVF